MNHRRRIALIAFGSCAFAAPFIVEGCTTDTQNNQGTTGICGNGLKEGSETCDDGNTNDADGCRSDCTSSTCGDGEVQEQNSEQCDDGDNNNDNACSNTCTANEDYCGNGTQESGEECDDGNVVTEDECTNACTEPFCGDGIVQEGEECDDGGNEINDTCPDDCMPIGPNPCEGQAIYKGYVNDAANPANLTGGGIPARWSYGGFLGVAAGNEMCAQIGADHACSWEEVEAADAAGELDGGNGGTPLPEGTEFWVHRLDDVERLSVAGTSPPGPGARCNDWTYPTNHIADGEFGKYDTVNPAPAMARKYGNVWMFVDDDAEYDPDADVGNPNPIGADHACDGGISSSVGSGTPGCSGNCGGAAAKAILCCFPTCE